MEPTKRLTRAAGVIWLAVVLSGTSRVAVAEPPLGTLVESQPPEVEPARANEAASTDLASARDVPMRSAAPAETPAAPRPAPLAVPRPVQVAPQRPRDRTWVETSRGDAIITFKREVKGSDIIALRGEGIVAASVQKVASVLLDYTRAPEWIDSLEEVRVVRMLGPLEFVEYDHVGTPPIIMKDRDFVCRGKLYVDVAEQSLVMTIEPTTDPLLPPTRYIRGTLRGYWKLKSIDRGRKTFVITEMHGDPRGSIAKWLVNLFQKGWARNTIESLREQVAKHDVKVMPQVEAAFEGKPIAVAIKTK